MFRLLAGGFPYVRASALRRLIHKLYPELKAPQLDLLMEELGLKEPAVGNASEHTGSAAERAAAWNKTKSPPHTNVEFAAERELEPTAHAPDPKDMLIRSIDDFVELSVLARAKVQYVPYYSIADQDDWESSKPRIAHSHPRTGGGDGGSAGAGSAGVNGGDERHSDADQDFAEEDEEQQMPATNSSPFDSLAAPPVRRPLNTFNFWHAQRIKLRRVVTSLYFGWVSGSASHCSSHPTLRGSQRLCVCVCLVLVFQFFNVLIFANLLALTVEITRLNGRTTAEDADREAQRWWAVDLSMWVVFLFELTLHVTAWGVRRYARDGWAKYNIILFVVSALFQLRGRGERLLVAVIGFLSYDGSVSDIFSLVCASGILIYRLFSVFRIGQFIRALYPHHRSAFRRLTPFVVLAVAFVRSTLLVLFRMLQPFGVNFASLFLVSYMFAIIGICCFCNTIVYVRSKRHRTVIMLLFRSRS